MSNSSTKRQLVAKTYTEILGRNLYNQSRRTYVFKKFSDGRYYSDCSSSICYSYKKAGFPVANLNTAGLYNSKDWDFVDVTIKNGQIVDTDKLRVGDILLYAGTDSKRPKCIGHVEMVYSISKGAITICGHGSGNPSKKNLVAYNTLRYKAKTKTPVGNKGLVCVKRYIADDNAHKKAPSKDWIKRLQATCNELKYSSQVVDGIAGKNTLAGCPTLSLGAKSPVVKLAQERLDSMGYDVQGIDSIFGKGFLEAVMSYQDDVGLSNDGVIGNKTWSKMLMLS